MINVLHLRDTDHVCGPGKTIIETALATDKSAFSQSVGLFLLGQDTSNQYMEAAVALGVEVIPIRSAHRFDPRVLRTLARIISQRQIHIIHSHEYKSDILAYLVSRVSSVAIMTTVHGWIRNHWKSQMYVKASQALMRKFDRIVAVSERTRDAVVASGADPARVVVIRNGIVTKNYAPENYVQGAFRSRYGIPADVPLIGYVGRLSPEKGQRDLLTAAVSVLGAQPDTWFALIGDGPDRASLEHEAAALGISHRVIFTGHLTDVRPAYRDLDVLALTSHTEGLPNVVLEASCMETAVLATAVGGTPEVVKDGVSGLLVPPRAPDAIAAGLLRLLEDVNWRQQLALGGRQLVHRQFNFSDRVASEEMLYREIVAGRSPGLPSPAHGSR